MTKALRVEAFMLSMNDCVDDYSEEGFYMLQGNAVVEWCALTPYIFTSMCRLHRD